MDNTAYLKSRLIVRGMGFVVIYEASCYVAIKVDTCHYYYLVYILSWWDSCCISVQVEDVVRGSCNTNDSFHIPDLDKKQRDTMAERT